MRSLEYAAAIAIASAAMLGLHARESLANDDDETEDRADAKKDVFEWYAPQHNDYTQAMHSGDQFAKRAALAWKHNQIIDSRSAARRAITEYERATRANPTAGEPHYRAAEVIYAHWIANDNSPPRGFTERAVEHWTAWRRLSPKDSRTAGGLFRRSIALTKLGGEENFRLAIADYEVQLGLTSATGDSRGNVATVVSNAAEMYMGVGELSRAITLYQQALDLQNTALYGYGLAVALQRDGQHTRAQEIMTRYARSDKLAALTGPGVFFVPEGEIHAYRALGFEALGSYKKARESYLRFLAALPTGRYAHVAREQIKALEGKPDVAIDETWGSRIAP